MSDPKPFHLTGNFAPVTDEVTATDLKVIGALPPELSGMYVRAGANPKTGHSDHWFLGHGMMHGIRIEGGRASWYRNRYVRTPFYDDPEITRISPDGKVDRTASAANTHVIGHAGRILALEEGSFPYVLSPELDTVGYENFDGRLETAFTAHPKICADTGELHFFGYGQLPPYFVYHRLSADGKLEKSEEIEVGGPTMHHDFAISRNHAIIMDLPVIFDLQLAIQGTMPFRWSDDYPARMGVLPRNGTNSDVRWFEIDPCYVFHTVNAWDDGNEVVLDACRISEIWRNSADMTGGEQPGVQTLHRWRFDMDSGAVREETLDERGMDFPRVADARVGLQNRYAYTVGLEAGEDGSPGLNSTMKLDMVKGGAEVQSYGGGHPGESVFVPAAGADPDSDEGWVMTYVYDDKTGQSEFVVVDASNFSAAPVARVPLPQRVPYGFHGSWIGDS